MPVLHVLQGCYARTPPALHGSPLLCGMRFPLHATAFPLRSTRTPLLFQTRHP
jgi:hypothetical protein